LPTTPKTRVPFESPPAGSWARSSSGVNCPGALGGGAGAPASAGGAQ
jgi:hypothetical protein